MGHSLQTFSKYYHENKHWKPADKRALPSRHAYTRTTIHICDHKHTLCPQPHSWTPTHKHPSTPTHAHTHMKTLAHTLAHINTPKNTPHHTHISASTHVALQPSTPAHPRLHASTLTQPSQRVACSLADLRVGGQVLVKAIVTWRGHLPVLQASTCTHTRAQRARTHFSVTGTRSRHAPTFLALLISGAHSRQRLHARRSKLLLFTSSSSHPPSTPACPPPPNA